MQVSVRLFQLPEGFESLCRKHPLLEKFMRAMERLNERNGRVVSHHIECRSGKLDPRQQPSGRRGGNAGIYRPSGASRFDAGIILQELENAGMTEEKKTWSSIATKGFCTMDPCIRDTSSSPRKAESPSKKTLTYRGPTHRVMGAVLRRERPRAS